MGVRCGGRGPGRPRPRRPGRRRPPRRGRTTRPRRPTQAPVPGPAAGRRSPTRRPAARHGRRRTRPAPTRSADRPASRPTSQRMPGALAVGDVVVRPAGLDHGHRDGFLPLGDRQVCGCADVVGEPAKHRQRRPPKQRMYSTGQPGNAEPQPRPAFGVAPHQVVRLERGQQPVHHGPAHLERRREVVDRQAVARLRQQRQHAQTAIQRLRRLGWHAAETTSARGRASAPAPASARGRARRARR